MKPEQFEEITSRHQQLHPWSKQKRKNGGTINLSKKRINFGKVKGENWKGLPVLSKKRYYLITFLILISITFL
ncbi:hypothetical protein MSHOH_1077 [Methanosarcina horonobensis HB-1 = JCM 15518]|uniref:Uncharacterized protein n=1 Tax=Methanosarcina horonobensis HB-1 = JCM 15518 TaxID=1434110 RepID=A0A0E3WSY1_9EURY|nr:hypothetical protein MSHOH_1077 [Methanosarcina horonobensis HB-1 = JCM 15518]